MEMEKRRSRPRSTPRLPPCATAFCSDLKPLARRPKCARYSEQTHRLSTAKTGRGTEDNCKFARWRFGILGAGGDIRLGRFDNGSAGRSADPTDRFYAG